MKEKRTNILLLWEHQFLSLYGTIDRKKYNIYVLGLKKRGIFTSRFYKKYFVCKKTEAEFVDQVNGICKRYNIAVIIPLDLSFIVGISALRHRLKYPIFPIDNTDNLLRLSNKGTLIELLDESGISHPKTVIIKNTTELTDTVIKTPFLIKPLMQGGGNGIKKINNADDLDSYKQSFSPYKTFPILAQEYIHGHDIDVSIFAKNGRVLGSTVQRMHNGALLEFVDDTTALSIGKKLVHHLRFSGLLHIDMRRDSSTGKTQLIECNPRAWGSMAASMLAGVDFIELGILAAQNKTLPIMVAQKNTHREPRPLLKILLRDPMEFTKMSLSTKQNLRNIISDPFPFFLLFFKGFINRIASNFAYTAYQKLQLEKSGRLSFLSPVPPEK